MSTENTPTHDPIRNGTVPELEAIVGDVERHVDERNAALLRLEGLANSPATSRSTLDLAGAALERIYSSKTATPPSAEADLDELTQQARDLAAQDRAELEELERLDVEHQAEARADFDELLIANGYAVIREAALAPAHAAMQVHASHLEAVKGHCARARARLQASTDPRAREALDGLEADLETFRAVEQFCKALSKLAERQAARERLLAR